MTSKVALALAAMMSWIIEGPYSKGDRIFPRKPKQRPVGYGVHIPKHIRKGLSYDELQELRAEILKRQEGKS